MKISQEIFNPIMVGKRVERLRRAQNLSIEKLAKKAGVNKNTIVRFEKGRKTTVDTIIKTCQALGVKLHELLEAAPVKNIDYVLAEGPETRKLKYGDRKGRKIITKGPVTIGDIKCRLQGGALNAVILELTGEGSKKSHHGEELLFCLTGTIGLDVNGKEIILNKGDGAVFWGTEPHSYSHFDTKKDKSIGLSVWIDSEIEDLEEVVRSEETNDSDSS